MKKSEISEIIERQGYEIEVDSSKGASIDMCASIPGGVSSHDIKGDQYGKLAIESRVTYPLFGGAGPLISTDTSSKEVSPEGLIVKLTELIRTREYLKKMGYEPKISEYDEGLEIVSKRRVRDTKALEKLLRTYTLKGVPKMEQ